jgi:predicted DCC family thiol-disulfide oxidoreductase YuxK
VIRIANPPARATLIYDGECGFCTRWVERIGEHAGEVDTQPYQSASGQYPEIPRAAFSEAVHWLEPSGESYRGAAAVFRFASHAGTSGRLALGAYEILPGFALGSEFFYGIVAKKRTPTSFAARLLWGNEMRQPRFRIAGDLFLRALGLVFLIAFLSLWLQIDGLIGSEGILPITSTLDQASRHFGSSRFWQFPTLLWFSSTDAAITGVCALGTLGAIVGIVAPAFWPSWATTFAMYLTLVTAGRVFTAYQWDALLLEAGFLAIVQTAPFAGRISLAGERRIWSFSGAIQPLRPVAWLYRWLLFRLMFSSGIVKLASNDEAWWKLAALTRHYETQPLPNGLAWYVHHLPPDVHTLSAIGVFAIEILVPFLFFAPRRPRILACGLTLLMQALIFATGNYTFFNLLAAALCIWLIDDHAWPQRIRERFGPRLTRASPNILRHLLIPGLVLNITFCAYLLPRNAFRMDISAPTLWSQAYAVVAPFRVLNTYGLFAVMTTTRPEILIEGSEDGVYWQGYEFFHKPGSTSRRPPFVAPHQPRLDWQMWFAALGPIQNSPWFYGFIHRLFEGSPAVKALLSVDPFPDRPPRMIRARMYEYRFSSPNERAVEGVWWKRTYTHDYLPPVARPRGAF